jgi:cyclic pyranopterin phosphate synthase
MEAGMVDAHGRRLGQLRLSVTDRCDLRCIYCMPEEGITWCRREGVLRFEEMAVIVKGLADRFGLRRVRLTGGEPLVRARVGYLVELLRRLDLEEITMTTNGQRLAAEAEALKEAGLTRVNVSLDTLNSDTYRRLTRGGDLGRTLDGIRAARDAGLTPVKINMVVLRGWNEEEIPAAAEFARKEGVHIRFLEAIAIGEVARDHRALLVPAQEVLERLGRVYGVEVGGREAGSTETEVLLKPRENGGPPFTVGLITSESSPFCSSCSRLRLSARGMLRGCLLEEGEVDLLSWVRDPERTDAEFARRVSLALAQKPARRKSRSLDSMARIGG